MLCFQTCGRQRLRASASRCARESGHEADQGEVWDAIVEKSSRMNAPSGTSAMAEIFDKYESDIEGYEAAMKPLARQAGALFAMNGAIKGLDLFDHPATLGKLLSKLVQSYALDAIDLAFHPAQTPVLANDDVAA